jgi:hypothetical protein
MAASSRPRPAVLCILDGWGHRPDPHYNAILDARTPNYDRLIATCPQGLIDASETFVGLPKGQMGNSEVGHMNLGAGRVAVPDLPRIDNAIADGSLAKPDPGRADRHPEEDRRRLPPDGLALAGRRACPSGPSDCSANRSPAPACRCGSTPSSTAGTARRAARMNA